MKVKVYCIIQPTLIERLLATLPHTYPATVHSNHVKLPMANEHTGMVPASVFICGSSACMSLPLSLFTAPTYYLTYELSVIFSVPSTVYYPHISQDDLLKR